MRRNSIRRYISVILFIFAAASCTDLNGLKDEAEKSANTAAVAQDLEALSLSDIAFAPGDTSAAITTDLTLPINGSNDTVITWASSNPSVIAISDDGSATVTRPSGDDVTVVLTATITKGSESAIKTFTVTVLATATVTHSVTFNANGGSGTMTAQVIAEGVSANLTANAFTRTGYTFAGWATTSGGTVAYMDGQSYTMGSADAELYAVWRACISISSITPDGEASVSSDTDIVIVFSDSLDGTTKGTVSFASPDVTFTDGDNATITFSTTNTSNDTITINPTENLQKTNYVSITIAGFEDSYSSSVTCSDSDYYFPVRGAMDLYFPFTNGSLEDASGRGVTLVKHGAPTLTAGHDGSANGAYSFDGIDDYLQVNGDLDIDCDADFTISAWIYLTSIGNYKAIVSNYHNVAVNGITFRINSTAGGTRKLDLSEGYSNANVVETGRWLHVVAVYTETSNTSAGSVQFYVNGAAAGSASTGYNIQNSAYGFAIGADYLYGGARYFPGIIDEIRFYKYALTVAEVSNLYNNEDIDG